EAFNNLLPTADAIDFRAHAASLGANAEQAEGIAELETALRRALTADKTSVVVIRTDPHIATAAGGHWWDVGVPEVSARPQVNAARAEYEAKRVEQRLGT
ncbi:MAG TPA: 3D-(3,5/4)-trihydroxycyclohexane-1,2-dione acylhydrolase (decyclizing), partial [Acetobacteraceae bacterium]|nr:3D-(3,5/4)-trihydroxycyclohexane-1,2-dione acylhydrolase (decyclizing) [Acetobacteraceae bacterium]